MNNIKNPLRVAAGLLSLALAGGAYAGGTFHTCGGSGGGSDPTCTGETWSFDSNTTVTASSFSTQSTPNGVAATAVGYHQDTLTGDNFTQRNLTIYQPDHLALNYNDVSTGCGSAGTGSECSPNHAFDNNSGYDMVVFQFDQAVTLSQIKMGWVGTDSDFSLFAWTPSTSGATPPGSNAFSIADLAAQAQTAAEDGWTLIGSFDYDQYASTSTALDLEALTAGKEKDILDYASSYWAIGAVVNSIAQYGAKYGSTVAETKYYSGGQWKDGNDFFKIAELSGCYDHPTTPGGDPSVPEPASMALVLLGLAGLGHQRRMRRAKA